MRIARRVRAWGARAGLTVVVLLGVSSVVPAQHVVVRPLDPVDAHDTIARPPLAAAVRDADGGVLIPVVDSHRAKLVEVAWYRVTGRAALEPLEREQVGEQEHGRLGGARLQRETQAIAALVAARAAGVEVEPTGRGVRVMAEGKRPDRVLRSGDVIVQAQGTTIATFDDLRRVVERARPGARLRVRLADGRERLLPAIPQRVREAGRLATPVALGVDAVETERPGVRPALVQWRGLDASGASSGLAMALAAYERLAGRAVAPGLTVVATGEVGSDGGVYAVGAVRQKAQSARARDADVLLVAPPNENVARANAGDVAVVTVNSLAQAIELLARRAA